MKLKRKLAMIDLFCGIGGLSHGFKLEGVKVLAGFDNDLSCKYAYEANNKAKLFKIIVMKFRFYRL